MENNGCTFFNKSRETETAAHQQFTKDSLSITGIPEQPTALQNWIQLNRRSWVKPTDLAANNDRMRLLQRCGLGTLVTRRYRQNADLQAESMEYQTNFLMASDYQATQFLTQSTGCVGKPSIRWNWQQMGTELKTNAHSLVQWASANNDGHLRRPRHPGLGALTTRT